MANLTYTAGLPNPPNFPSQDVGGMQTNTNSINTWVTQDHYGFNTADNSGGYHDQVSMQNQAAPGLPGFGLNPNGVLFANNPVSPATAPAWPYWQNSLGNFQLSGSASANVPLIATNGYTFLPGGLLLQWGVVNPAPQQIIPITVNFNTPFISNCFSIVSGRTYLNVAVPVVASVGGVAFSNIGLTSFDYIARSVPAQAYDGFYWVAIGN